MGSEPERGRITVYRAPGTPAGLPLSTGCWIFKSYTSSVRVCMGLYNMYLSMSRILSSGSMAATLTSLTSLWEMYSSWEGTSSQENDCSMASAVYRVLSHNISLLLAYTIELQLSTAVHCALIFLYLRSYVVG